MNSDDLRAMQAPLKDKYKTEPAAALVTLRASGSLGENVTCKVETGKALVAAGLHPATGGDERLAGLDLARHVLAEGARRAKRDQRGGRLCLVAVLERRLPGAEVVGVHGGDGIE